MSSYKKAALFLCLTLTVLSWIVLFPKGLHRPAFVDDAWGASYVWNLTKLGTTDDLVMGNDISNIRYFGHIYACTISFLADTFSWSSATFHGFNLLCLLLAAPAWYLVGKRVLKSAWLSAWCVLLLYLTGAFIGCAYIARSDAFAFLFVSWGTYCAAAGWFFPAALLCSIAIETHAISATGYFYLAAFFAISMQQPENKSLKRLAAIATQCVMGILIGFTIYRFMHPEPLKEILAYLALSSAGDTVLGLDHGVGHASVSAWHFIFNFNALTSHYFYRAYMRFIPELVFLVVGSLLFFWHHRNRGRELLHSPLVLLFTAALLASVIINRPCTHYVPFFYPPLFLLAIAGYDQTKLKLFNWKLFNWAVAAFVVYCLLLAGLLAFQYRHVDRAAFDRDILQAVPQDNLPVIGPQNAWFPLRERFFYVTCNA